MPIPWAVTLTRATKSYLVDGLGLPASRVRWIPPGAGQMPTWEPSARGIRLPEEPYVLTVAGSDFKADGGASRREFATVLEGFEACLQRSRRALRLLVLGEPTLIQRQQVWWRGLGRHVEFLGSPPPLERARILASARVYLPTGEGDGAWLQVREALGLGIPMVVPHGICLDEILGDACLTYPRRDHAELAVALARCMESDDLTRWLSRRAMARARAFSWTDFTLKLLDLLSEAAREPAVEAAIPAFHAARHAFGSTVPPYRA
jgi:glycosyltransferase involved in cell wall biosynthesis